jgi:UPF0716 family protein affecting phage T7 exclusion
MPRRILGWLAIIAGLLMLVLPGPGFLALALGIILLGPRDPALRRSAVAVRLVLRRLSHAEQRHVRVAGWWLRARHRNGRQLIRDQVDRQMHGQPVSPSVKFLIGIAAATAAIGLGISLFILLS